MKTPLLLLGALLNPALACDSHDLSAKSAAEPTHLIAATKAPKEGTKSAQPASPTTTAPKPAGKERTTRPARPEYLFL